MPRVDPRAGEAGSRAVGGARRESAMEGSAPSEPKGRELMGGKSRFTQGVTEVRPPLVVYSQATATERSPPSAVSWFGCGWKSSGGVAST
jgi:hypothetical protein